MIFSSLKFLPLPLTILSLLSITFCFFVLGFSFPTTNAITEALNSVAAGCTILWHLGTVFLLYRQHQRPDRDDPSKATSLEFVSKTAYAVWLFVLLLLWLLSIIVVMNEAIFASALALEIALPMWNNGVHLTVLSFSTMEMVVLGMTMSYCITMGIKQQDETDEQFLKYVRKARSLAVSTAAHTHVHTTYAAHTAAQLA